MKSPTGKFIAELRLYASQRKRCFPLSHDVQDQWLLLQTFKEALNRLAEQRVNPVAGNFSMRLQNESTVPETWVWQDQSVAVDRLFSILQQIQINYSRSPVNRSLSSELFLRCMQQRQ